MEPNWNQIMGEIGAAENPEWYHHLWGATHVTGRTIASAFGGAGLADAAEGLQSPILPSWAMRGGAADIRIFDNAGLAAINAKKAAKGGVTSDVSKITDLTKSMPVTPTTSDIPDIAVHRPEYVALFHNAAKPDDAPQWAPNVGAVAIWGGKRFAGPGYKGKGKPGKTFDFGYNVPVRVDVLLKGADGKFTTVAMKDIRQVAFAGGIETGPDGGPPPIAVVGSIVDEKVVRSVPVKAARMPWWAWVIIAVAGTALAGTSISLVAKRA